MWDSHFRVGGALGTDLDLATGPNFSNNAECIAASLMFRVTAQSNGYFENVWAWVSDHDNDQSIYNQPDSSITQISIFGARGMLIESQGLSWFYGGGSEHSVLYSFFNEYYQDCVDTHNCQERILEVKGSTGVVIFNLFTVAIVDIASGIDGTNVPQDGNQRGFTTEVSVWLPLPGADNIDIVWVGTEVWSTLTVTCSSLPCMLIIPTSSLSSDTTN